MRRTVAVLIVLAVMVTAVFWPLAHAGFVDFDDDRYVTRNSFVRAGLTWEGVKWAFGSFGYMGNWHPLTWLSHMLDVQFLGLHAAGHHLVSLAFHGANTLLLFLLLHRMTGAFWPSALVAALFGIHPLHVESVALVTERKGLLSALFWLLTLWAYLEYLRKPGRGRYLLAFALFILSLLAKPMAVTLPIVLFLLDGWPLGRWRLRVEPGSGRPWPLGRPGRGRAPFVSRGEAAAGLVLEKAPFMALAALAGIGTYLAQSRGGAVMPLAVYPAAVRATVALMAYASYAAKTLWPSSLAVFYPYPPGGWSAWELAGAGLFLLGATAVSRLAPRRAPYLTAGWLWYLVTLLPVAGLVKVGEQVAADRYTYLPLIGLFMAAAWGLRAVSRRRPGPASAAVALVLAALMAVARVQTGHWRDNRSLFERAVAVTGGNWLAHNNLGVALDREGRRAEAIGHYQTALRFRPGYVEAHNNLGIALAGLGRTREAVDQYREALRLSPGQADVHFNLANVLSGQGDTEGAIGHYREAVRLRPDFPEAYKNLGSVLARQGRLAEAAEAFAWAAAYAKADGEARFNLAWTLERLGRSEEALLHYREAARLGYRPR